MVISKAGVMPDPDRMAALAKYPVPTEFHNVADTADISV